MRYLCLVCFDAKQVENFTPAEWQALTVESLAYDDELRRTGHYIASNALQSTDTATTVRMRNGKISTTDGPFAETKEQVAGFIMIEAADLDEAIRLGAGIPLARIGSIEVRPVLDLG